MAAAALLPAERGPGDEPSDRDDARKTTLLEVRALLESCPCDRLTPAAGARHGVDELIASPDQADVSPHQVAHLGQTRHGSRIARHIDGLLDRGRRPALLTSAGVTHRLGSARTEYQALEQRIAGQAVGSMDAGAGDLPGREQAFDR